MPTLVVQLGHCYRRTGATGTIGEQEYATKVGNACRALLHGRGGWSVRVILADDPASSYAGDAFFAIHCDGSTSPTARGASVGYRTPEGQAVAQAWKRAYAARGWPGFRPDNYTSALAGYYGTGTAVSRGTRRAVILECGFRTNSEDRALLDGPGGPERVALSIGDALGIPVTPPEVPEVELNTPMRPYFSGPGTTWPEPVKAQDVGATFANIYSFASSASQAAARAEAKVDALSGTITNNQAAVLAAIADNGVEVDLTTEQMQELLTGMTTASKQALRELLGSLDN